MARISPSATKGAGPSPAAPRGAPAKRKKRPSPPTGSPGAGIDWLNPAQVAAVKAALAARTRFRDPRPGKIELRLTHISAVLLTPSYVFKFKRAVNRGFVDFSTLDQRRHFCREECRLNRRLAADVYLDVVSLRETGAGYAIGGRGVVVDHAVVMRRLPQHRMLDTKLARGAVSPATLGRIAGLLAGFHRRAPGRPDLARFGQLAVWRGNWKENFAQIAPHLGTTLSAETSARLEERVFGFMKRYRGLFARRVAGGFIKDGHGDLRCEHIYLGRNIRVIDCIEFNERFRFGDVGNDLAFLLMDLAALGHPALSQRLLAGYVARAGDRGLMALMPFYCCYRAFVRGKVDSMRLEDANLGAAERKRLRGRARRFFSLAEAFSRQMPPPVVIVLAGLMGAGKSNLARQLAASGPATVFSSDAIRKELAGRPAAANAREPFGAGIYTEAWTRRTYGEMFKRAEAVLAGRGSVVLDASFAEAGQRRAAFELAEAMGAEPYCVEVFVPDSVALRRLRAREREGGGISEGRAELYPRQKERFQPTNEIPRGRRIRVRGNQPPEASLAKVLGRRGLEFPEPLFTWHPGSGLP